MDPLRPDPEAKPKRVYHLDYVVSIKGVRNAINLTFKKEESREKFLTSLAKNSNVVYINVYEVVN